MKRSESGVAMIELVIVLSFLALLLFGMIDFGNTYNDAQNLRQGVREVAREATTDPSQFPDSASVGAMIVSRTGLDSKRLTISWTPGTPTAGTFNGGDPFELCVNYATQSITGYAKSFLPAFVHSNVKMRMEPRPSATFPVAAPSAPVVASLAPCS